MKVDDTNRMIISQLQNGRKSYAEIAGELMITENTVRSRANKMMEEGTLKIQGLVNPDSIEGLQIIMIGVKSKSLDIEEKLDELSNLRGVIHAVAVTGRYDIIIWVELFEDDNFTLTNFLKYELSQIEDIDNFETYLIYSSRNLMVPYLI